MRVGSHGFDTTTHFLSASFFINQSSGESGTLATTRSGRQRKVNQFLSDEAPSAAGRGTRSHAFFNDLIRNHRSKLSEEEREMKMKETEEERAKATEEWEAQQKEGDGGKQNKKKGGVVQKTKAPAPAKKKKREKGKKVEESNEEDDDRPCMKCGDNQDEMVICDTKLGDGGTCDNVYHLGCVGLDHAPEGEVRGSDS